MTLKNEINLQLKVLIIYFRLLIEWIDLMFLSFESSDGVVIGITVCFSNKNWNESNELFYSNFLFIEIRGMFQLAVSDLFLRLVAIC
jgi:hypothetical protein